MTKEPRWLRKTGDLEEIRLYHMIRAVHMAGRCIECDECERVCPVGGRPLRIRNEDIELAEKVFRERKERS